MKPHLNKKQTDPVCGMEIDSGPGDYSTIYDKRSFYFCSQGCLDRFNQNRERFARAARKGIRGVWSRYLDRVQKATDGKPPCCH